MGAWDDFWLKHVKANSRFLSHRTGHPFVLLGDLTDRRIIECIHTTRPGVYPISSDQRAPVDIPDGKARFDVEQASVTGFSVLMVKADGSLAGYYGIDLAPLKIRQEGTFSVRCRGNERRIWDADMYTEPGHCRCSAETTSPPPPFSPLFPG